MDNNFFKNRNKNFGILETESKFIKIVLYNKNEFEKVKKNFSEKLLNWIKSNSYFSEAGSVLCIPDEKLQINKIYAGVSDPLSFWDIAKILKNLPFGNYKIADKEEILKKYAVSWSLENYKFNYYSSDKSKAVERKNLILPKQLYKEVTPILEGCYLARDLINLPANYLTPEKIEKIVFSLSKQHKAKLTVTKSKELKRKYPLIYFVGRASETEPRLLDLNWEKNNNFPNIVLVGKGVTFDSGGLDLKPPKAMELMKKDMGGAAIAIGLAHALMLKNLKINLRILLPIAENAVSNKSMRPSDVIKSASGINVEIGNTDAEGRLILADALYEANRKRADLIVDLATLTGAARIALGTELPAMFSNNKSISKKIIDIGSDIEDPLWELPLHKPYDTLLDIDPGYISNIGSSSYGGAITAALFLSRFINNSNNWIHIDLMGWNLATKPGRPKGGESMTLRTLFEFISKEYG